MSDRERTLPRWARDDLQQLRSQLATAESRLQTMGTADSRVYLGFESMTPMGLPEFEPVTYVFGEGSDRQIRVTVDFARGELTVRGGDTISVLPEACNAVTVKLARR